MTINDGIRRPLSQPAGGLSASRFRNDSVRTGGDVDGLPPERLPVDYHVARDGYRAATVTVPSWRISFLAIVTGSGA